MPKMNWRGCIPVAVALLIALGAQTVHAQGGPAIATVGDLVGRCLVTSYGESQPRALAVGTPVYEGDRVRTAADARLKLQFVDGSVVQLGENTNLSLDWFRNNPELETRSVFLRLPAGILRMLVALVVPHSAFEVQTATAVASVRGTDWITEASADATAIVALAGRVAVRSAAPAIVGEVVLGPGVGAAGASGQAPQAPTAWGAARKASFIERTAVP